MLLEGIWENSFVHHLASATFKVMFYRIIQLHVICIIFPLLPAIAQDFELITSINITQVEPAGGVAWGDYDGDGFLDLFVAPFDTETPDRLFRNNRDGSFTLVNQDVFLENNAVAFTAAWGDTDNDGDLDLAKTNINVPAPFQFEAATNVLYLNNGDGTFSRDSSTPISTEVNLTLAMSWADYNNDGLLDFFASTNTFDEKNLLYTNTGNGSFSINSTGIIVEDEAKNGHLGIWGDYNNDGNQDLFVANQGACVPGGCPSVNYLYANNGDGSFSKIVGGDPVRVSRSSVGASWGDMDNDGDLDLYVTNWDGNEELYINDGDGTFSAVSEGGLVGDVTFNGSAWGDMDNDGDLDLITAGQAATRKAYFSNNGDGSFTWITNNRYANYFGQISGISLVDYDNDGDLDIYGNEFGPTSSGNNTLFKNLGTSNNWLNITLRGIQSNSSGIGARVKVKAIINGSPIWQMREIASPNGAWAQGSLRAHFGLGDASRVDSLVIDWPASGIRTVWTDLEVNDHFLAREDGSELIATTIAVNDEIPSKGVTLLENYPNPFSTSTTISFNLAEQEHVRLRIIDLLGREINTAINERLNAGSHNIKFEADKLSAGIYLYQLQTNNTTVTRRMTVIK